MVKLNLRFYNSRFSKPISISSSPIHIVAPSPTTAVRRLQIGAEGRGGHHLQPAGAHTSSSPNATQLVLSPVVSTSSNTPKKKKKKKHIGLGRCCLLNTKRTWVVKHFRKKKNVAIFLKKPKKNDHPAMMADEFSELLLKPSSWA